MRQEKQTTGIRNWHALAGLLLLMIVLQATNTLTEGKLSASSANAFSRTGAGEWWRLFTGQLIHLDWVHLIVDGVSIAVVWVLVMPRFPAARLLACFLAAGTLGQAFGFLAWRAGFTTYESLVGSSDALHGLVYLYIAVMYRRAFGPSQRVTWLIGMAVLMASTVYTCIEGHMPFSQGMKSPGYNHLGGILAFVIAIEAGFLRLSTDT